MLFKKEQDQDFLTNKIKIRSSPSNIKKRLKTCISNVKKSETLEEAIIVNKKPIDIKINLETHIPSNKFEYIKEQMNAISIYVENLLQKPIIDEYKECEYLCTRIDLAARRCKNYLRKRT